MRLFRLWNLVGISSRDPVALPLAAVTLAIFVLLLLEVPAASNRLFGR